MNKKLTENKQTNKQNTNNNLFQFVFAVPLKNVGIAPDVCRIPL